MEKKILVRAMTLKQFEAVVEDEYEGDRTSADLQTQSLKLNRLMGDFPLQEALAKHYKINAEVAEVAQGEAAKCLGHPCCRTAVHLRVSGRNN